MVYKFLKSRVFRGLILRVGVQTLRAGRFVEGVSHACLPLLSALSPIGGNNVPNFQKYGTRFAVIWENFCNFARIVAASVLQRGICMILRA